jgi:hypothetical protein
MRLGFCRISVGFLLAWSGPALAASFGDVFETGLSPAWNVASTENFEVSTASGAARLTKSSSVQNGSTFLTTCFQALGDFTVSVHATRLDLGNTGEAGLSTSHEGGFTDIFFVGSGSINANLRVPSHNSTHGVLDTGSTVTFRIRRVGETLIHEYDKGDGFTVLSSDSGPELAGPVTISVFLLQEFGDNAAQSVEFDDFALTAAKFSTTTQVSSSQNPSNTVTPVTFTASVACLAPTGTVTFFDGDTEIGTGTLDGSFQAHLTIPTLTGGSHAITATYNGDADSAPSTSTVLEQLVDVSVPALGPLAARVLFGLPVLLLILSRDLTAVERGRRARRNGKPHGERCERPRAARTDSTGLAATQSRR